MTRRSLALVVFAVASLVISACSQSTAPRRDDGDAYSKDSTGSCNTILAGSAGRDDNGCVIVQ
jgi:uncharacterized lipoprotein